MALESAIVRIRKSNETVVGAGFLVSEKHVITCAHVVADALGIARDSQKRPTEYVHLDFPLVAPEESLTGRVVFWHPVPPRGSTSVNGKEDIAVLELNSTLPEAAKPVDLLIEENLRGHSFRTFGFPTGHDDGLEATGVLRGKQGTGWVQIEDVKETGVRLEPGFSGAPIWDEQLDGVVGMAVAADQKRPEAKVAFMIPIPVIASNWKALAEWTTPPLILTKKKHSRFWRDRPWLFTSIALLPLLGGGFILMTQKTIPTEINICKPMSQNETTVKKIVIANIDDAISDSKEIVRTEQRLLDRLQQDTRKADRVEVCLANKIVKTVQEAQELGNNQNATIVIWGRRDRWGFKLYLKGIKKEIKYLNSLSVPPNNPSETELQDNIPGLISIMTGFAVSLTYYLDEQIPKAREVLLETLDIAESKNIGNNEFKKILAEAYFFLGTMFDRDVDDSDCRKTLDACQKALDAYGRASQYHIKPYQNLLNKGILHEKLNDPEQAIKAYSTIINHESESHDASIVARSYRSDLFLDMGKTEDAIKDLEIICEQNPDKIEYYHALGLAQLQAKKIEDAKKTYKNVSRLIVLNPNFKNEIIANLKNLAEAATNTNIKQAIGEILPTLSNP